jgi:hypothetical protein
VARSLHMPEMLRRDIEDRKDCRQTAHDRQADRPSSSGGSFGSGRATGSERSKVLQMDEVTLVDVDVVRFLNKCETEGVRLINCSPYIREWMSREKTAAKYNGPGN